MLGLGCLGGGGAALLFERGLLLLGLGAQVLVALHELGIVIVDLVQQVPVRGELAERRGAEQQVQKRAGARAVHALRAVAQTGLHIGDLDVDLVDALLRLIGGLLGLSLLLERLTVVGRRLIELVLHGIERGQNRLRLGLLGR